MSFLRLLSVVCCFGFSSFASLLIRADSMGPASKRTALTISEVMYHPATRPDGKNLEFIEIFNSENVPLDLSNYRLDGDVSFTFPTNTTITGLGFVIVAAVPADVKAVYRSQTVFGPFENGGALPNDSGKIELWSRSGALLLEVEYDDSEPWPVAADGSGHSMVLARPTFGQNNPKAWAASGFKGGSPGDNDPTASDIYSPVEINEILAHTDDPEVDYVELYNHSNNTVDLTGCILTDDVATNKFVIGNVSIPARGYISFTQTDLGFSLSAAGETIYFKNPSDTRVVDVVRFGGQENGVSYGRFPNGGSEWYRLATKTPGAANDAIRQSQVVINEIMYSPMSGDADDQYVEIYNSGATPVNLGGWRLAGGIGFEFPAGKTLAADSYLVIANNATRLISRYTNLDTNNTLGNFSGKLSGSSERITLTMPDTVVSTNASNVVETNVIHIAVDEVTYQSGGRWSEMADGGGSSLELIDSRADRRQASNWAASDETRKAPWTTVEHTGVLDNGTGAADQLQVHMQGEGECLIDDVEVIPNGGANLITNPSFETDASGWVAQGTQDQSSLDSTEGYNSTKSYHVRAVDRGDTGANRIRYTFGSAMTIGSTATIRAKVRWLRGHPEILFRLRGNYLEAIGQLNVPTNLGTPGAKNSRAVANAGPAIYDVIHSPVLPVANQAFAVTARVNDPDAPVTMQLNYRVDPTTTFTTVAMNDNGALGDAIAGDGIYTALVPAQAAGAMVAFYVRATDSRGAGTLFPNNAPARECYARVGETQPAGSLGTYRLWMSAATASRWSSRGPLDNTPLDVTFVYGNERVIYNMEALYAGSPYIAPGYNGPTGALCGYTGEFPKDDLFLGVNDFVLDWPGRDNAAISENISFWIADECDLPNSHRRFIHLHVNGVTSTARGSVYEDVQQPGGDMIKEWSPADTEGNFYKVERWFEFSDTVSRIADPMPRLENYVTTGGAKKLARYRWNFLPRAVKGSVNDYDDIFALVDAVNATSPEPYTSQTEALVDIERFMGIFAMERVINNFDSWGHQIGKNNYVYKPVDGRWISFMFDNDWLMIPSDGFGYSVTAALFTPCEDPTVARMYNHPPFRRAFLRTIKRAVEAMAPEKINPLMDAKYAALTGSGVTRSAGTTLVAPTNVKNWISGRRNFLITQLDAVAAPFAITTNGGADFETTTNVVALSGTAPIEVMKIAVNGISYPIQWTTVTNWTINVPLSAASTQLLVQGLDRNNAVIPSGSDTVTVTFRGTLEAVEGNVVFNEIMYHPAISNAGFIEIRSLAQNTTYDLSNWRIEGAGFVFPQGTLLSPGGYLVVAKDRAVFAATYGTSIPLAGEFGGQLQNDGETLWLIKPGATPPQDVVIDQVAYSDLPPWPPAADGLGASLQLIDAAQDNTRAFNWGAAAPSTNSEPAQTLVTITDAWKYDQSGTDRGTGWVDPAFNDSAWPSGPALLYVETSALPAPKSTALTIGQTTYYFRRHFNFTGDPTKVNLNLSTVIDDGAVFYLNGHELHRIAMDDPISYATFSSRLVDNAVFEGPFDVPTTWLKQGDNVLAVEVHQNNAGSGDIVFGMTLDSAPQSNPVATPGKVNSVARSLPTFPRVWINELQPVNISGPTDELGQHDPWVELYNSGATTVSLNGWYLSDSVTNLTRWPFPTTASIQPGERLLIWLDAQASATQLHASFRAAAQSGTLALIGPFDGAATVLDYVNYAGVPNDRSIGRFPDGDNLGFELFFKSTPGAANDDTAPALPLFINEWMASNSTIADPSDGHFDDWFEIYNPNNVTVDLTGYLLTDNLADPRERYTIPNGWSIGPGQFMLIWADGDAPLNPTQLHVPFKLDRLGENIGLFAPNGALVDSITFGLQTNNISQGRSPDGGSELSYFTKATPGASNVPSFRFNTATLDQAGNVSIVWQTQVGQTYRVQYKRDLSDPTWTDLPDVTATDVTTQKLESASPDATRFYRVLKVSP